MTEAERTYTNLMIFKTLASTSGRVSVKQIHQAIEPNMGISVRSLQRYFNGLASWGLVAKDGKSPQGFRLTDHARQLFAEMANGSK